MNHDAKTRNSYRIEKKQNFSFFCLPILRCAPDCCVWWLARICCWSLEDGEQVAELSEDEPIRPSQLKICYFYKRIE